MSIAQLMNALALGALLTMLSSGLALIYGLRNVMNFAHGGIYMLAAYTATAAVGAAGFWVALVVVPLGAMAGGVLLEYAVLRPLAGRSPITLGLVLFGLALVLENITTGIFGADQRIVRSPSPIDGTVSLAGTDYPAYRLFLIVIGLGSVFLLVAWLRFTRSGLHVRAVSAQPQTARMAGVNTNRLGLVVVCLSTGFAGLAGVLAGPYLAVDPGMGNSILIICLIIVVLGGVGSIGGAIAAALLVGFVQVIGNIVVPDVAAVAPYVLLVAVLVWRPQGLGRGRVGH